MTYGIQIDGVDASGTYNVADSSTPAKNYYVASAGTFNSQVSVGTLGDKDLFMVRPDQTGSGHNNAYQYARTSYAVGSPMGRLITSEDTQGRITSASLQTRTMEYVHLKDAGAGTAPSSTEYGIKILNSTGGILFDSRRIVTANSFRITNFTTPGQAGGNNGVLYSGSDANTKYVDVSRTLMFYHTAGGDTVFYMAGIRWAGTQINWFSRVQVDSTEAGLTADNYLSSPAILIGDKR